MACQRRRRAVAAPAGLAALGLLGARVARANANAPFDIPVVRRAAGEWVELDGAFLTDSCESTAGYAVRVASAEAVSRSEYVRRCSDDGSELVEGAHVTYLAAVDLDVRNEDSADGHLDLVTMFLTTPSKNEQLVFNRSLYLSGEKALRDHGSFMGCIGVRPGTECTTHAPYMPRSNYKETGGVCRPPPTLNLWRKPRSSCASPTFPFGMSLSSRYKELNYARTSRLAQRGSGSCRRTCFDGARRCGGRIGAGMAGFACPDVRQPDWQNVKPCFAAAADCRTGGGAVSMSPVGPRAKGERAAQGREQGDWRCSMQPHTRTAAGRS